MKTVCAKNRPVLFLDSGIGGIPYCMRFLERNASEKIVYLADREHFPYGKKERGELKEIIIRLMEQAVELFNPKISVLACNTATLAALPDLRSRFPGLPFVGTVPAVKPAVLAAKTGKIGVLGTELTIREPYIKELAANYGSCEIIGIAAQELVEYVENCFGDAAGEEKRKIAKNYAKNYIDQFRKNGVDSIVLGCTHFLFLLDEFKLEAEPGITIFESIDGISHRIESLLEESGMREQAASDAEEKGQEIHNQNKLVITGGSEPESSWVNLANRLGFRLSLLNET